MKQKCKSFEESFNVIQKIIMAEMLLDNDIERVKYILYSNKVQYSDELATEIKAKYGKKRNWNN